MRKTIMLLVLTMWGAVSIAAEGWFTATVDLDMNALQVHSTSFSDENIRPNSHGKTVLENLPFSSLEFIEDTEAKFEADYQLDIYRFGGHLKINKTDGIGGLKAWVNAGSRFRLTAGTDIESVYADSLDADPGLRIYNSTSPANWKGSKNIDNITQDKGLLLELFLPPLTVAMAGNYSNGTKRSLPVNVDNTQWKDADGLEFQYGARVGSEIGQWGKINVSYILQYKKEAGSYNLDRDNEIRPFKGDAEMTAHNLGLYASLTSLPGFALTLGYCGVYTKYLDEFNATRVQTAKTLLPGMYQNGINLNARYKGIANLTLRTDHNVSFWTDRDYRVYDIKTWENIGPGPETLGSTWAPLRHTLLWNGLGLTYKLTPKLEPSLYARNLYREDTAKQENGELYKAARDELSVEVKMTVTVHENLSLYAGITVEHTTMTVSKALNAQGAFSHSFVPAGTSAQTTDADTLIKIPVGLTLKIK